MAGRFGIAAQSGIGTGTAAKTLLQLVSAAGMTVRLVEFSIGFHGTNNTNEPVLVEIVRQSTAGTTSANTPVKADDQWSGTLATTARHTATAEPTTSDVLFACTVHPQTALIYQLHDLAPILFSNGGRIGVRVTAANNVNADVSMRFEE